MVIVSFSRDAAFPGGPGGKKSGVLRVVSFDLIYYYSYVFLSGFSFLTHLGESWDYSVESLRLCLG